MDFIVPNWPAPRNIKAFSTIRRGGVSQGGYDSLNLGGHVGDDARAVSINRSKVSKELKLPAEPLWLDQTHSSNVIVHTLNANVSAADGIYTSELGAVCTIMTADCLPLFLIDAEGTEVAAVHAGWRGLADGVIEAAVKEFQTSNDRILAWAGPCIGPTAFQIGQNVKEQVGGPEAAYIHSGEQGKYLADLPRLAQDRLASIGVSQFFNSNCCTYSDSERFFSYRRDGQTGRMASFIWMDSE